MFVILLPLGARALPQTHSVQEVRRNTLEKSLEAVIQEVRRNTLEKFLKAVIQEAKMELEQEKRTSVRMGVSSFQKHHYENVIRNTQNCSSDENSNIYQNTSFHRQFINYNFPTPVEMDKEYEVMSFRRLSGPYIEMTPGKLVTAV